MKPLVRWTVGGNIHPAGLKCLKISIRNWKSLYGNEFDLVICHNSLSTSSRSFLDTLNVPLIDQNIYTDSLPVKPNGNAWKLYPPRLNPRNYEVFIDNDLILHARCKELDSLLVDGKPFVTEGMYHNFGRYADLVSGPCRFNSGLFGIGPEIDLAKEIEQKLRGPWEDEFDEQGMIASIISKRAFRLIPRSEIYICDSDFVLTPTGSHFVRLNRGYKDPWNAFWRTGIHL